MLEKVGKLRRLIGKRKGGKSESGGMDDGNLGTEERGADINEGKWEKAGKRTRWVWRKREHRGVKYAPIGRGRKV